MTPVTIATSAELVDEVKARASLVAFDPEQHRYTVNGVVKPSVTQVIDAAGFRDLRFVQNRTDRGIYVHQQTLHVEDGILDMDTVPEGYRGYVDSYAAWFDMFRPVSLLREQVVYDPAIDVTGTLDRLFVFAGELEFCDFKAGVPQPWHKVQTAGYRRLVLGGLGCAARRSTLILRADGKPAKRIPHEDDREDEAAFLNAVGCWHWKDRYIHA